MNWGINKIESGYERLAIEIILRAVKDYRNCLKKMLFGEMKEEDVRLFIDAQDFFCSEHFSLFTDVDPQYIRKNILKETLEEALAKGDGDNG